MSSMRNIRLSHIGGRPSVGTMPTIAFLGLGHMGSRMAARLVAAGHEVTAWNRTRAKAEALTGAKVADTPAEAGASADIVITMLTGPDAVESVLFGADGVTTTLRPDAVLVEMSTIGPTAATALASRLPAGVGMVDAPVGGSIGVAERGELALFVGGTDADIATVTPVLDILGTIKHCGGPSAGAAAKLVAITALVSGITLLGELRELGAALDLPVELTERLLAGGPLGTVLERAKGGPGSHYVLELAAKDLGLTIAHADAPLVRAALARLDAALPERAGQDLCEIANNPRET
jgi:3-hydroxyisobutyrate dehydrogenase-like beta-hydroxyacid dehydrogenase